MGMQREKEAAQGILLRESYKVIHRHKQESRMPSRREHAFSRDRVLSGFYRATKEPCARICFIVLTLLERTPCIRGRDPRANVKIAVCSL